MYNLNMQRQLYRLDDSVLAQLVKLLQLAMLTQTDISDHMRQIVLEPSAGDANRLVLTPEYREKDAKDVQKFLDEAVAKIEAANPSEN